MIMMKVKGESVSMNVSIQNMIEHGMLLAIVEAPFKKDIASIQALSVEVGELIEKENDKLNNISALKKGRSVSH